MANRRRHSRRADQFVADEADELSRLSLQHFHERASRLHRSSRLPPIALIFIYFRHYIALPDHAMTYVLCMHLDANGGVHAIFITYSLAMMAFWILEISTIVFIVYSFEYFLGGQMFPIDIMPNAVQAVMKWLPFYYELFCPIAIFLERLQGAALCAGTGNSNRLALAHLGRRARNVETRPRPLSSRRRLTRRVSVAVGGRELSQRRQCVS